MIQSNNTNALTTSCSLSVFYILNLNARSTATGHLTVFELWHVSSWNTEIFSIYQVCNCKLLCKITPTFFDKVFFESISPISTKSGHLVANGFFMIRLIYDMYCPQYSKKLEPVSSKLFNNGYQTFYCWALSDTNDGYNEITIQKTQLTTRRGLQQ